jgi:hypothetical protein
MNKLFIFMQQAAIVIMELLMADQITL